MIDIMTKVFKSKLYCYAENKLKTFPTLRQLRGKIIAKTSEKMSDV
jgi:hypothetical protein